MQQKFPQKDRTVVRPGFDPVTGKEHPPLPGETDDEDRDRGDPDAPSTDRHGAIPAGPDARAAAR